MGEGREGLYEQFQEAYQVGDWAKAIPYGKKALAQLKGDSQVTAHLNICEAVEHSGRWLELAAYAQHGVEACEDQGVTDRRYALLLRSLGRGLYERMQFERAMDTYSKLLDLAVSQKDLAEVWVARYSRARCMERIGTGHRYEALNEYKLAAESTMDCSLKMASVVNRAVLLLDMDRLDEAFDEVTSLALVVPQLERVGSTWGELLRVTAHLEMLRGRIEIAYLTICDALEVIPETRTGALARTHGVRALIELRRGNATEAQSAVDLAWRYAEQSPSADVRRLLCKVEQSILMEVPS